MKRGTPRHPKIADLMELGNMSLRDAIGTLELLWHFTAEFAPQGDIGRFSDKRIEAAIDWRGKAGTGIKALVESRWIDTSPSFRLVTHDWHDHADDATRKRLHRSNLSFLSIHKDTEKLTGSCRDNGGQRRTTADNGGQCPPRARALPEPEPEPEPVVQNTAANCTVVDRPAPGPAPAPPPPKLKAIPSRKRAPVGGGAADLREMLSPRPDEAATVRLWRECRARDPECTPDEIAGAWNSRAQSLGRDTANPIGLLLTAIPPWFDPGGQVQQARAARQAAVERERELEAEADEQIRRTAADPNAPAEDREFAMRLLEA